MEGSLMLVMFRVKNFSSFKDEAVLDMRATSYVQHPEHVVEVSKKLRLLKTAAIYGANAAGKSNFIRAMYFFQQRIFDSYNTPTSSRENDSAYQLGFDPFLLSSKHNALSEFEIAFYSAGKLYQYGFSLSEEAVHDEWFEIDEKPIYTREDTTITFHDKKYAKAMEVYQPVIENRLFMTVLNNFLGGDAKKELVEGFSDFFGREYDVYRNISIEFSIKNALPNMSSSWMFSSKEHAEKFRNYVLNYVKNADFSIADLIVKHVELPQVSKKKSTDGYEIVALHNVYDDNGEPVKTVSFSLDQESSGTKQFLQYVESIVRALDTGGVFIVDEIASHLHPLLVKMIVDLFQSAENTAAQLIFTTHDISLLNRDQFRRDEVMFVEKDEKGCSSLFSLSDIKVREDASFSKDYLQGKYGAIPIISEMLKEGSAP